MKSVSGLFLVAICYLYACRGKDSQVNTEPLPGAIFTDFNISGEEGNDSVTILLQFRDESGEEENIGFDREGAVTLDGEAVPAGHSKMLGIYYETRKSLASFSGEHTIVFTDRNKRAHRFPFPFEPLLLQTVITDTLGLKDLELKFVPLKNTGAPVRVRLTDTSYLGDGINRLARMREGKIIIRADELAGLHTGPVMLQCLLENESETADPYLAGGWLSISFGLRREFFLQKKEPGK